MVETHPFEPFVPENTKYMLLGSFPGRLPQEGEEEVGFDWYYGTKRNQFWSIVEAVYDIKLPTKQDKMDLFTKLGMGITDVIQSCYRKNGTNLDDNLVDVIYNFALVKIINDYNPQTIFFTSHFAHKLFRENFRKVMHKHPDMKLITLPSPSPRYMELSKAEKVEKYKELLPKLN